MHCRSPIGKIRVAVIICCLVLILGIFAYAYLSNRNNTVLPKDEIIEKLEDIGDENYGYKYVSSYLKKYGISNINDYKINTIEAQLEAYYYKDLPDERELAYNTSKLFIEYFYDKIDLDDKEDVTDSVLKCLFASIGDPYAYYRTADEFNQFIGSLEGGDEFVGIGVLLNQETLEIQMVYRDSGAEAAGILRGDVIHAVNGTVIDDSNKENVLDMIKGEVGTTVEITVDRGGELITLTATRMTISQRSVLYDMDADKVGNIQIYQFLSSTVEEFKEAVDYCVSNGAVALVIDVRSNPGGLLDSVIDVIDYLVPDASDRRIASFTESGKEYVFYTEDGHSVDLPIAVICNSNTASAGELFTAALRDYGDMGVMDTVIVGTTTYGKGVVQNSYTLYDKSGITFTIGYFNPPCNVNFNGIGVIPDVEVNEVIGTDAPFNTAKELALGLIKTNNGVAMIYGAAA